MSRLVCFRIPVDFVTSRVVLTGAELACGVRQGWISIPDAVTVSTAKLGDGFPLLPTEESLALLLSDEVETAGKLLGDLEISSESTESRERVWLFLALSWVAEHRSSFEDPYETIESLYADFGYPAEISSIVRWMPAIDGRPTGLAAIDENWRRYLDQTGAEYDARLREP